MVLLGSLKRVTSLLKRNNYALLLIVVLIAMVVILVVRCFFTHEYIQSRKNTIKDINTRCSWKMLPNTNIPEPLCINASGGECIIGEDLNLAKRKCDADPKCAGVTHDAEGWKTRTYNIPPERWDGIASWICK